MTEHDSVAFPAPTVEEVDSDDPDEAEFEADRGHISADGQAMATCAEAAFT